MFTLFVVVVSSIFSRVSTLNVTGGDAENKNQTLAKTAGYFTAKCGQMMYSLRENVLH